MLFFLCWLILVLAGLFLFYCAWIIIRSRLSYLHNNFPGTVLRNPIFGNTLEHKELNFFDEWKRKVSQFGPVYKFYTILGQPWLVVADPESVRHILLTNSKNYVRGPLTGVEIFRKIVGKTSMLVTDGPIHRKHRAITSPAFRHSSVKKVIPLIHDSAQKLVAHWMNLMRDRSELSNVNIRQEMSRITLAAIGSAGFGFDFDCIGNDNSPVVTALEQTIGLDNNVKLWHFLPFVEHFPTARVRTMWRGIKKLQSIFFEMIQSKKSAFVQNSKKELNLLDMIFLSNSDGDHKNCLDDTELRDELMTFILAGHETSSLTLTYAIWQLCVHPNIQEQCREEIMRSGNFSCDTTLCWDSFSRVPLTKAVIYETLRLFPPIPLIPRTAIESDFFYGKHIPAGTAIGILIAHMHRMPEVWRNPESFSPERFLEDQVPWDTWIPFGEGNHKCLGYQFALMEMTLVLCLLLKNFRFRMHPENMTFRLQIMVTLQPADPVLVTVDRV